MAELLRVTQVLGPFAGYGHIEKPVLDWAAARGTMVHGYCNCIIKGLPDIDDIVITERHTDDEKKMITQAKGYVNSFRKWLPVEKHITLPDRFEDHELGITGECDGIWIDEFYATIFKLKFGQYIRRGKICQR